MTKKESDKIFKISNDLAYLSAEIDNHDISDMEIYMWLRSCSDKLDALSKRYLDICSKNR